MKPSRSPIETVMVVVNAETFAGILAPPGRSEVVGRPVYMDGEAFRRIVWPRPDPAKRYEISIVELPK